MIRNKHELSFYFFSKRELNDFTDDVKGYTTVYSLEASTHKLTLNEIMIVTKYIPELTSDQEIFNNYSKAIAALRNLFGISSTEQHHVKIMINRLKKLRLSGNLR